MKPDPLAPLTLTSAIIGGPPVPLALGKNYLLSVSAENPGHGRISLVPRNASILAQLGTPPTSVKLAFASGDILVVSGDLYAEVLWVSDAGALPVVSTITVGVSLTWDNASAHLLVVETDAIPGWVARVRHRMGWIMSVTVNGQAPGPIALAVPVGWRCAIDSLALSLTTTAATPGRVTATLVRDTLGFSETITDTGAQAAAGSYGASSEPGFAFAPAGGSAVVLSSRGLPLRAGDTLGVSFAGAAGYTTVVVLRGTVEEDA